MPEDSVSVTRTEETVLELHSDFSVHDRSSSTSFKMELSYCRGSLRFDNISDNARATNSNRNPNMDYDMNFIPLMELSIHRILYLSMLCQLTR